MKITLIPIGDFDYNILQFLNEKLSQSFGCPIDIVDKIIIPFAAYNTKRNQYDASKILSSLSKSIRNRNRKALGITDVDLYSDRLNFVFGQADSNSGISIISLVRLRQEFNGYPVDENLFTQRTLKEAIHELGHTFGLGHCQDAKCVMHFSTSLQDTDIKGSFFCSECRPQLIKNI